MHQAIPYSYKTYFPTTIGLSRDTSTTTTTITTTTSVADTTNVGKLVSENAVIVFGRRGCCMCHVVKRLLQGLGVNPTVSEVDDQDEAAVINQLLRIIGVDQESGGQDGSSVQFPVVFVGGKLFGGLERVMATHISGELVPILKEAGALWL